MTTRFYLEHVELSGGSIISLGVGGENNLVVACELLMLLRFEIKEFSSISGNIDENRNARPPLLQHLQFPLKFPIKDFSGTL